MRKVKLGDRTFLLPFVDLIPIEAEDDTALGASVEAAGRVREPVVVWKERRTDDSETVVDGAHRVLHAARLKLAKVPVRAESFASEDEAKAYCLEANYDRRHAADPARKHRAERIARAAKLREGGESLRSIAEKEGVSKAQVERDLVQATSTVPPPGTVGAKGGAPTVPGGGTVEPKDKKVKGKDGRTRTAKPKKPKAPRPKKPSAKRIAQAVASLPEPVRKQVESAAAALAVPAPPDESPWVDDWGIPVTRQAEKAFQAQALFDELLKRLRECKKLYKELADHPGGAYLTRPGISLNAADGWKHAGLETCLANVRDCRPTYTVCPYAYSAAKGYQHGKDCTLCHGLGWVRPLGKDEVPASLIAASKKANGVA